LLYAAGIVHDDHLLALAVKESNAPSEIGDLKFTSPIEGQYNLINLMQPLKIL